MLLVLKTYFLRMSLLCFLTFLPLVTYLLFAPHSSPSFHPNPPNILPPACFPLLKYSLLHCERFSIKQKLNTEEEKEASAAYFPRGGVPHYALSRAALY